MHQKIQTVLLACITLLITLSLIVFPEQSFHASIRGLHTWWETVFPSLLPFFITAELLIGFGVVQFVGVLFEPIMRPLFNVPGVGSFAWIVGMASGYPSGAKISVLLRERNEISRIEAERLISFSNASSPLFIFGAISVGFFHNATLGIILALCHYIGNGIVGICMRFYGRETNKSKSHDQTNTNMIVRAFSKMHRTRMKDERPFGQIIGDAVVSSIQTLIMIGGFIILFSVFTTLLNVINITALFAIVVAPLMKVLHIPLEISGPLFTGFFEITMGSEMVSKLKSVPLVVQLATVSFILGFNGFSIQAQVASIIAKTDIRFLPYFFARILHAIIASILTIVLYKSYFEHRLLVQQEYTPVLKQHGYSYHLLECMFKIGPIVTVTSIALAVCILLTRFIRRKSH